MGGDQLKKILFKGDKVIWAVFFIICAISWVEVFSATSRQVIESGSYWMPIIKHTIFLVGGMVVVWFMHNMKVEWIKHMTHFIYWVGLIGLIWAQLDKGSQINGSARWIKIMGLTIQPMEFAKMGMVMITALITSEHQGDDGVDSKALKRIILYCLPPVLLILKENLSTAAIVLLTLYMMMFVGRFPKDQMLKIFGIAAAVGSIGLAAIMFTPDEAAGWGRFGEKIVTWKHRIADAVTSKPVTAEEYEITNEQRTHANIAIASSHIFGRGPGNSEARNFIPHAYSDFIYAVIIEELGLAGGFIVLLLYMTILYRCGKIARKCEDSYPAFLIMGVGMIITMQAMLHMFITVGDFVTGQPLPLISQGGTSVLINCIYIGMVLSISRYAKKCAMQAQSEATEANGKNV